MCTREHMHSIQCLPHNQPGFTPVTYVKRTLLGDMPAEDLAHLVRALLHT